MFNNLGKVGDFAFKVWIFSRPILKLLRQIILVGKHSRQIPFTNMTDCIAVIAVTTCHIKIA